MKTFTIAVSLLVALGCAQVKATSIVVIRTAKHIVIAEDSLWLRERAKQHLPPAVQCKMKRVRGIYFTAATVDTDARQLEAIAWEAMAKADSVADAAHKFSLRSDEIAQRTAEHAPQSFIDMCWGKSCTEALFFGIERGVPTLVLVKLEQVGNSRKALKFMPHEFSCPGSCPSQPKTILCLGQHKDIDEFERSHPKFLENHADEETARKLVQVEEKAVPQWVGGPIDVLTLDELGAHWTKGGTCAASANAENDKPPAKLH